MFPLKHYVQCQLTYLYYLCNNLYVYNSYKVNNFEYKELSNIKYNYHLLLSVIVKQGFHHNILQLTSSAKACNKPG